MRSPAASKKNIAERAPADVSRSDFPSILPPIPENDLISVQANIASSVTGNVSENVYLPFLAGASKDVPNSVSSNTSGNVPSNVDLNVLGKDSLNVRYTAQAINSESIQAPIPALDPLTVALGDMKSSDSQLLDGFSTDGFGDYSYLWNGGDMHDDCGGDDNDGAENSDDLSAAPGRISDASLERIQEGLHEVQKLAKDIATETGLSPSQVFHRWMSASQRTHTKRNPWNLYSAYFKDNEQQERQRLKERESTIYPCSWYTHISTFSHCW